MKTKKALLLALCAILLVAGSVYGTYAYLTSKDSVSNTFTLGKVNITMDEAKVDVYGAKVGETRVQGNEYKLVPGHTYTKDPVIHFTAGSEASYLFVKLENGIQALESDAADYISIAAQMTANDWLPLDRVSNVYYKSAPANTAAVDYPVFASFRVDEDITKFDVDAASDVNITAYAVQADGLATATAAWNATFVK